MVLNFLHFSIAPKEVQTSPELWSNINNNNIPDPLESGQINILKKIKKATKPPNNFHSC